MTDTFPLIRDDVHGPPAIPPATKSTCTSPSSSEQESDSLSISDSHTQTPPNESVYPTPVATRNIQSHPKVLYKTGPERESLDAAVQQVGDDPPVLQCVESEPNITHVSETLLRDMDGTVIKNDAVITSTPFNNEVHTSPNMSTIPMSEEISSPSVTEKVVSLRLSVGVQTTEADEVKQLKNELSACKSKVKMIMRDKEELHHRIAEMKDEISQSKALEGDMELLKSTKDENDKLIIKVSALEAGIKVIEQQHDDEKQSLVTRISELEAEISELESVKVEKESAAVRVCELEAEILQLEAIKAANMEYDFVVSDKDDSTSDSHSSPTAPNTLETSSSNPEAVTQVPSRPSWDNDAAFCAFSEPVLSDDDTYEHAAANDPQPAHGSKPVKAKKKKKKRKNVVRFRSDSKTHFQLSNLHHCYLQLYGKTFISREPMGLPMGESHVPWPV